MYDYSAIATATPVTIHSSFSATQSIFSPDAKEFVSKRTQITEEIKVDHLVQLPTKKKKKKKKKASTIPKSSTATCEGVEDVSNIIISNPNEEKVPDHTKLKEKKKKKMASNTPKSNTCDGTEDTTKRILYNPNEKKVTVQKKSDKYKSVHFQESSTEEVKQLESKNSKLLTDNSSERKEVGDSKKPPANVSKLPESDNRRTKISFAEKLKSPAPMKSPFLDWRDQRTSAVNEPMKPRTIVYSQEKAPTPPATPSIAKENPAGDDGFVTVSRKKPKEKKSETTTDITKCSPDLNKSTEADAKKKLEKERKKLREKEKKKRAREERLLTEKLAPKGQKVTIITPKTMEKFLQSSRSASAFSKPVVKLSDDMFPALGKPNVGVKGNVSESESEWETIEVIKKEEPIVQRSVKRTDPIKFDLMALITKKSNKKKPSTSDSVKKNKNRPGLVANVLDRSAPTLSRGKIRNKKRKLSEIRKALLAAKAKRKAARESQDSTLPSSVARPHALHSKKFREYCDQILTDQIGNLIHYYIRIIYKFLHYIFF